MKKSIKTEYAHLNEIFTALNIDSLNKPEINAKINTLAVFIKDNWNEINWSTLKKINQNAYHFLKAKDVCSVVAIISGKPVKGYTLQDAFKSQAELVMPCLDKQGKQHGYLVINRHHLGGKANSQFRIRLSKEKADAVLFSKMDEVVENILTGKYRGANRQPLTYKSICTRWNTPSFYNIVKMQGFTPRRFYNELLPSAIERYAKKHPDFVQAVIDKNGKRWANKSNLQEFVDRFSERIGNACAYDFDLRNASH